MVAPEHVTEVQGSSYVMLPINNICKMGLRKGMAILVYYVVESTRYQVVLLAQESVLGKRRQDRKSAVDKGYPLCH